jgi:hypothetical protein
VLCCAVLCCPASDLPCPTLSALPPLQAVFLLIGKTSALTMNIAGVIKDWMLIFFSFYLFHAPVTRLNLFGYAFCCTGVGIYNYQKLQVRAGNPKHGGAERARVGPPRAAGQHGGDCTALTLSELLPRCACSC